MADVLDIDNAEEFEVDDEGDREFSCNNILLASDQRLYITSVLYMPL